MLQLPRLTDFPRIRTTLKLYKVSSVITGTFLLLLCLMMVFRYGFGQDIELGGPFGFLTLTPKDLIVGINLSTIILIIHGWLYVAYLACDFVLWRLMGWSFARFLFIALGGVIPLLSFFFERTVPKRVNAELAAAEARGADRGADDGSTEEGDTDERDTKGQSAKASSIETAASKVTE